MASQGKYCPSNSETPENKKVTPVQDVALNTKIFNELLAPKLDYIKSLVHYYRNPGTDEGYLLSVVLEKLYRYANSYDPEKSLDTWIHICVKRHVFKLNNDHYREMQYRTGVEFGEATRTASTSVSYDGQMERKSMLDSIPDEVYNALMKIPEYKLRPFMRYVQGYTIRVIAEMEYEEGHTSSLVEEVVKGRVFWTRNKLQELLKDYAKHRGLQSTQGGTGGGSHYSEEHH